MVLGVTLLACSGEAEQTGEQSAAQPQQTYEWKLVTTWPKNFPGIGMVSETFADLVEELSEGRMSIRGIWRGRAGSRAGSF